MSERSDISNNSGPASSAEPSMEEILASIRRILKDEGSAEAPPPEAEADVLVLDASMLVNPADISSATEPPAATATISVRDDGVGSAAPEPAGFSSAPTLDSAPEQTSHPQTPLVVAPDPASLSPAFPAQETYEMTDDNLQSPEGLVGANASDDIANSIGSLVRSISAERAVAVSRGGPTLEDIVREEIRPILKNWMDNHLPVLVERIVRAEIERVIDRSQA